MTTQTTRKEYTTADGTNFAVSDKDSRAIVECGAGIYYDGCHAFKCSGIPGDWDYKRWSPNFGQDLYNARLARENWERKAHEAWVALDMDNVQVETMPSFKLTHDGYMHFENGALVGVFYDGNGELEIDVYGTPQAEALSVGECSKLFEAGEDDETDVYKFLTEFGIREKEAHVIASHLCANILRAHGYVW